MTTKNIKLIGFIAVIIGIMLVTSLFKESNTYGSHDCCEEREKGCVFLTIMGEEPIDSNFVYKTPSKVLMSLESGLQWIAKAQQENGGWGAGSHYNQNQMDPHAVNADPATTSMVSMAILRSGSNFTEGKYSDQLNKALVYLLTEIESAPENSFTITEEKNTQIQTKLGANIDVVLTAQYLTNALDYLDHDSKLKARVEKNLQVCVDKIQKAQSGDGSFAGGTWAGVLQSSFANNALESAQSKGMKVDDQVLEKSREYQKGNYNANTGDVKTSAGAGIVLYAVSGSVRASAKDARKVKEEVKKAQQEGKIEENAPVTKETLEELGYSEDEALKYATSYNVYESAKNKAQDDDVLQGFGNNGGEEFLSFLQTGESMIINKDESWKKWYDNMSGRLLHIQNTDGSWNGHHCITSPVFCTATCVLILSVNNDIENLVKLGSQ